MWLKQSSGISSRDRLQGSGASAPWTAFALLNPQPDLGARQPLLGETTLGNSQWVAHYSFYTPAWWLLLLLTHKNAQKFVQKTFKLFGPASTSAQILNIIFIHLLCLACTVFLRRTRITVIIVVNQSFSEVLSFTVSITHFNRWQMSPASTRA